MLSLLRARHFSSLLGRKVVAQQQAIIVGVVQQLSAAARRPFSDGATAASAEALPTVYDAYEWHYPKSQKMFEKITAALKTEEEVRALQREVYVILGRPLREAEFYHDGFGTKKARGGGGGGETDGDAAKVEVKQTSFDIKLVGFDASAKIKVIKEIRSMAGLGLKEAKDLVESAPTIIQKSVGIEAAEEIKAKLVELGAIIELV